jgi:hypothetical protein
MRRLENGQDRAKVDDYTAHYMMRDMGAKLLLLQRLVAISLIM